MVLEVFKAIKGIGPAYVQDIFKIKDQPYNLRNPLSQIQAKKKTTNHGLRTFGYLGSKLWNDIPATLKNLSKKDISLFKSRLKDWSCPHPSRSDSPLL